MTTPLYGIDNGGPRAGIVHQGRVVLVGSPVIPDLVMASKVGDVEPGGIDADDNPPVDFALTERVGQEDVATPASGFWFEQVSARGNAFHAVVEQEGLFIIGDQGESTIPAGPFTAAQVEIRENSWYGTERGFIPLIVGGLVLFVQAGARDLRGINWDEVSRKYIAPSLLERSGQVFGRTPLDRDFVRRLQRVDRAVGAVDIASSVSSGRRPDSAYVVDADGRIAIFMLPAGAWCHWETAQGAFTGIAAPGPNLVFLVERDGVVGVEYFDRDEAHFQGEDTWRDPGGQFITARFQTLPFVAQSRTGTKRGVTKSRVLQVIVDFVTRTIGRVPQARPDLVTGLDLNFLWVGYRRPLLSVDPDTGVTTQVDRPYIKKWPRRTNFVDANTEDIVGVKWGGMSGWRRRAGIGLQTVDPCEIAGIAYKASG